MYKNNLQPHFPSEEADLDAFVNITIYLIQISKTWGLQNGKDRLVDGALVFYLTTITRSAHYFVSVGPQMLIQSTTR